MKEIETDKILLKIYEEQQQMKKDNEENQKSIEQKIYNVQEQMEQKIEENQKSIEQKIYENQKLMEQKIYESQQEIRKEMKEQFEKRDKTIDKILKGQQKMQKELTEVKEDVRNISKTVAKIEVEHGEKLEALFDAFTMNSEKLDIHEKRINDCERKVETHDDKIYYIEKDVKQIKEAY